MPATASRPEPGETPADAPPVDVDTIRTTVERALVQGPVPRYATLEELEGLLRGHLQLLLPYAQRAGAGAAFLEGVRQHLADGMGHGLMSARIHVRQLAHDTRALLAYAPGADR